MEKNIKFNFDEIMVRIPPALEGEVDDIKSNEIQERVVKTPKMPVEPIQIIQERSQCIRKESVRGPPSGPTLRLPAYA